MPPQLLTVVTEETLKTWTPDEWAKWWIEPKLDGARMIYHKGKFFSRTGKPLHNLEHIAEELATLPQGWTLDGEVYGADWASTMSAARASKTVKAHNGLRFGVFDILTDMDWEDQSCPGHCTLRERRKVVAEHVHGLKHTHITHPIFVDNLSRFLTVHSSNLGHGCDGTVLKRWDSLYEFKRTKTWLKVKPRLDADGVVVGMKEGEGKYKGMCGALEVLPEGALVTTFVSGMIDQQRNEWWALRETRASIIGKTIEVKIRGVHPSSRWIEPRFHRIREDK